MNSKKQLNEIFGVDDAIAAGLAIAVPMAFKTIMNAIARRNDYKRWLNKPEIMMMDELVKDDEWVKQVYNDIKNDNDTIKAIKTDADYVNAKGKKPLGTAAYKQNTYDASMVKKWLENPIAEKALENVFKKKYPNIDPKSGKRDIPGSTGNVTYAMWRRDALNGANYRFVQSLHSGNTISHLNKWADKHELEKIDTKKQRSVSPDEIEKQTKAKDKLIKHAQTKYADVRIKNPQTGNDIKITSALGYDKKHPVFKAAVNRIQQDKKAGSKPNIF
jgi:hypothetical protein